MKPSTNHATATIVASVSFGMPSVSMHFSVSDVYESVYESVSRSESNSVSDSNRRPLFKSVRIWC